MLNTFTYVSPIDIENLKPQTRKIIDYKNYVFTFGKKIEIPKIILSVKSGAYTRIPIFTEGSLSTVQGKSKSKKTAFILTVIQAFVNLFNDKLETSLQNAKILYADTEQSEYYVAKNAEKISRMTGIDYDAMNRRIIYLRANELTPEQKRQAVEDILEDRKIDYVILDNISDFLRDYNSSEESTNLKLWLTQMINKTKAHFTCVIHETAGMNKAKGHIGSLLEQFAETVLVLAEDKDAKSVSRIYPKNLRGKRFDEFGISFDDYGIPYLFDLDLEY